MKRVTLYTFLGILGVISGMVSACHTNYLAYEEEKDGIYVSTGQGVNHVITTFPVWDSENTRTVQCTFNVLGFPTDNEREVRIEIVDSLTTAIEGKDYNWSSDRLIMPADEVSSGLTILTWNRRSEEDTRSDTLSVGFQLVENENFRPVLGHMVCLSYLKTVPSQPRFWNVDVLGPWSPGLMYRFYDQYNILKETHPEVYASIYQYAGDYFNGYWPYAVEYPIIKYIIAPLYNYYQDHPEPNVVMIPKPKYE